MHATNLLVFNACSGHRQECAHNRAACIIRSTLTHQHHQLCIASCQAPSALCCFPMLLPASATSSKLLPANGIRATLLPVRAISPGLLPARAINPTVSSTISSENASCQQLQPILALPPASSAPLPLHNPSCLQPEHLGCCSTSKFSSIRSTLLFLLATSATLCPISYNAPHNLRSLLPAPSATLLPASIPSALHLQGNRWLNIFSS